MPTRKTDAGVGLGSQESYDYGPGNEDVASKYPRLDKIAEAWLTSQPESFVDFTLPPAVLLLSLVSSMAMVPSTGNPGNEEQQGTTATNYFTQLLQENQQINLCINNWTLENAAGRGKTSDAYCGKQQLFPSLGQMQATAEGWARSTAVKEKPCEGLVSFVALELSCGSGAPIWGCRRFLWVWWSPSRTPVERVFWLVKGLGVP